MINVTTLGSGSSGNCYVIDDGHSKLIIETGVKFAKVQQTVNFDFSNVVGVFISHEHLDHVKYIKRFVDLTAVDFYASGGTFAALGLSGYRFNPMLNAKTYPVGNWLVTPFDVKHDAVEPFGFIFQNLKGERLLYVTDTYYVKYRFKHITHMMVEMNYSLEELQWQIQHGNKTAEIIKSRLYKSHFEMENSLAFIKANQSHDLQRIWLIHISHNDGRADMFKRKTMALTGVPVELAGW